MIDWITTNRELVCICACIVICLVCVIITSALTMRISRLRKRLINIDIAMGIYDSRYTSIDFSKIKEGTRRKVLKEMKPIIHRKIKEGTFSIPSPFGPRYINGPR